VGTNNLETTRPLWHWHPERPATHRREQSHSFTQEMRQGSDFYSNNQEQFFTSIQLPTKANKVIIIIIISSYPQTNWKLRASATHQPADTQ